MVHTVWISPVECILIVQISVEEDLMPGRWILEALRSQNNFPVKSFTDLHDGMSINGAEILLKLGAARPWGREIFVNHIVEQEIYKTWFYFFTIQFLSDCAWYTSRTSCPNSILF